MPLTAFETLGRTFALWLRYEARVAMAAAPGGWTGAEEDGAEDGETVGLAAGDVTDGDPPTTLPALVAVAGLPLPTRNATAPTAISTTTAATPISMPRRLVRRGGGPDGRNGPGGATSASGRGSGSAAPGHCRSPPVG